MIGIVQVGMQAMADRYMYVPIIGLAIMVAWGVPSLINQARSQRSLITGIFVVIVVGMMYGTYVQVSYWKNDTTLLNHALSVTKDNYFAHYCLGLDLADSGKTNEAIQHFREVIRINPTFPPTYNPLAAALSRQGKFEEAIRYFQESFRLMPTNAAAHNNYGVTLAQLGKLDEAGAQWQRAIEIDPYYADAHANLGRLFSLQRKTTEAIEQFEAALRLDANHVDAHFNYGELLAGLGKIEDARYQYQEALRVAPGYQAAQTALRNLGRK
jgi:pentatricopeptide repeat protein